jgi:VIT1/CCC1 family predicted Fe2+/Mn2+ transporter
MRSGVAEKKSLWNIGSEIYSQKQMIAESLNLLADKSLDQSTRNLLLDLSQHEKQDFLDWKNQIELLVDNELKVADRYIRLRVRIMMSVLGSRGFLEWLLIAEDENVEKLMITADLLVDRALADRLTRLCSDERLHVVQMKREVLGMEGWEMGESGGISDLIFGANDGLVSILALVAGVYGAVTDSQLILITGISGAIAGTISMGAGAYLSAKSEKEVTQKEKTRKGAISGDREQTKKALLELYIHQGMSQREAGAVAARVADEISTQQEQTIGEVVGLTSEDEWPPSKAGILTGVSFLIASVIPIFPFTFLDVTVGAIIAALASIVALFSVGASKAAFTRSSWLRSGFENLVIGVLAAAATFIVGILLPGI